MRITESDNIKGSLPKQMDEGVVTLNDRRYMMNRTLYASDKTKELKVTIYKFDGDRRKEIVAHILYSPCDADLSQEIRRLLKKWKKFNAADMKLIFGDSNITSKPYPFSYRERKKNDSDDVFVLRAKFKSEIKKYLAMHPTMILTFGSIEDYEIESLAWEDDHIFLD